MNNRLSLEFGQVFARIPLKAAPHIVHGDALETDWAAVFLPERCSYILGNPPFIGHQWRTAGQAAAMGRVWGNEGRFGRLDFVTCWFKNAADYGARNRTLKLALVSTNSITQGEQASILWPAMLRSGLSIIFAHRTFPWGSDARGKAAVHCVIIGMGWDYEGARTLFDYPSPTDEPTASKVENINGYLLAAPDVALSSRTQPKLNQLAVDQRMAFARSFLKLAGAVENSRRAVWSLTPAGAALTPEEVAEIPRASSATMPASESHRFYGPGQDRGSSGVRWALWAIGIVGAFAAAAVFRYAFDRPMQTWLNAARPSRSLQTATVDPVTS